MLNLVKFIIGLSITILLGYFVKRSLKKFTPKLEQPKGLEDTVWATLAEPINSGQWVGFFERILCLVAFWIGQHTIIAGWFAFKLAAKWEVWKNIIRFPDHMDNTPDLVWLNARSRLGSSILARFLLGTLLNVLIGATSAYVGMHSSGLAIFLMNLIGITS